MTDLERAQAHIDAAREFHVGSGRVPAEEFEANLPYQEWSVAYCDESGEINLLLFDVRRIGDKNEIEIRRTLKGNDARNVIEFQVKEKELVAEMASRLAKSNSVDETKQIVEEMSKKWRPE